MEEVFHPAFCVAYRIISICRVPTVLLQGHVSPGKFKVNLQGYGLDTLNIHAPANLGTSTFIRANGTNCSVQHCTVLGMHTGHVCVVLRHVEINYPWRVHYNYGGHCAIQYSIQYQRYCTMYSTTGSGMLSLCLMYRIIIALDGVVLHAALFESLTTATPYPGWVWNLIEQCEGPGRKVTDTLFIPILALLAELRIF